MADLKAQAAKQLRNIEENTGTTVAQFARAVQGEGLEKHGQIVAFFKARYGLTHGNANSLAHAVREKLAGGPAAAEDLLAAQFRGPKAGLLPIYEKLADLAAGLGDDVEKVVQKTGVSFRRQKQFALVQVPSSKRVQLGLNLDSSPDDDRIVAAKGMCTHRVDITEPESVDDDIASWLRSAYDRAG